jgi:cytochrome c
MRSINTVIKQFNQVIFSTIFCLLILNKLVISQSCTFPPTTEFKSVEIFKGMVDPSHMAVQPDGSIFAIEQWSGNVHLFIPGKGASVIGTVPTNAGRAVEDGMLGIVADINYPTTHWIYILHTPAELGSNRLSRYTVLNGTLTNPKLIFDYPRIKTTGKTDDQRHAGGGMAWNRKTGDLFIATGDDTNPFGDRSIYGPRDPDNESFSALRTSANTNDLRGKSLRIRPIAFPDAQTPTQGVGSTYTIPQGNLFPTGQFTAGKTRPEIYSMGHRNAYRVKVDSVTGWAFVGEVGADAQVYDAAKGPPGYDKITLVKKAGNAGWPFTNGNLEPYIVRDYETAYQKAGYTVGQAFDLNNLKNISPVNTGLTDLPSPPIPPLVYYCANAYQKGVSAALGGGGETIMSGPTYDYNPKLVSAVKLPPFFHRKVIFGDFSRHYIWLMTLDTAGTLTALNKIVSGPNVIDMEIGPDGTLYYLDYGAGAVMSLQYTGLQKDPASCTFIKEGCMDSRFTEYDKAANLNNASLCKTTAISRLDQVKKHVQLIPNLRMRKLEIPAGSTGVEIFTISGQNVFTKKYNKPGSIELPASIANLGLLYINFLP